LVGSFAVGLALNLWTSSRAGQDEARRIRLSLLNDVVEIASRFRIELTVARRSGEDAGGSGDLASPTEGLTADYKKFFIEGRLLESRLRLFLDGDRAAESWHGAVDCLIVLYYSIVGAPEDRVGQIRREYARQGTQEHTGLGADQLTDLDQVNSRHHELLEAALRFAQEDKVVIPDPSCRRT
jgi:hypothetical protein